MRKKTGGNKMAEFVTAITTLLSGLFGAIITAFGSLGELFFRISDAGALEGLTPFGWLSTIIIGIPLATWLFNKAISWIKQVRAK